MDLDLDRQRTSRALLAGDGLVLGLLAVLLAAAGFFMGLVLLAGAFGAMVLLSASRSRPLLNDVYTTVPIGGVT